MHRLSNIHHVEFTIYTTRYYVLMYGEAASGHVYIPHYMCTYNFQISTRTHCLLNNMHINF